MKYSKTDQTGRKWIESEGLSKWQGKESDLQRQCEQYLELFQNIATIRIPDAVYRAIFASSLHPKIKRLISGYIKGLPDIILLKEKNGVTQALCVELKTETGKMSQGQKAFAKIVTVHVVRSFESFVELVDKFNS